MTEPANDNPGFLLSSEILTQNAEPLIGQLTLSTDQGDIIVTINQDAALALIEELAAFLDTE